MMNVSKLSISILIICFLDPYRVLSQSSSSTKFIEESFNSLNNQNKSLRPKIELLTNALDSIPLSNYAAQSFYDMIDFNKDSKNDILIIIEKDYRLFTPTKPSTYKNVKKRILIVAEFVSNQNYKVKNIFNLLLNQYSEGLYSTLFIQNPSNNSLIIREYGRQIDTDWATDLQFKYDQHSKSWFLQKSVTYSANIQQGRPRIKIPIKTKINKSKLVIDSVDYYKEIPFGFTDEIPAK